MPVLPLLLLVYNIPILTEEHIWPSMLCVTLYRSRSSFSFSFRPLTFVSEIKNCPIEVVGDVVYPLLY